MGGSTGQSCNPLKKNQPKLKRGGKFRGARIQRTLMGQGTNGGDSSRNDFGAYPVQLIFGKMSENCTGVEHTAPPG